MIPCDVLIYKLVLKKENNKIRLKYKFIHLISMCNLTIDDTNTGKGRKYVLISKKIDILRCDQVKWTNGVLHISIFNLINLMLHFQFILLLAHDVVMYTHINGYSYHILPSFHSTWIILI